MMIKKCDMALDKMMILFDGECILCDSFINFVIKRDKKQKFQLAYLQSKLAGKFDISQNLDTVILVKNGRIYQKSSAILRIIKELGGLWCLAILLLLIPGIARDFCYDFIGNRRYKWFGKKDKCITDIQIIKDRLVK